MRFPLPLRSTRAFIGYSLFNDRTTNLDLSGIGPNEIAILSGTRSTISSRIVRDVRNNPVFPTAGNLNTVSARFVGGPLGGDGDYTKWEFASEWWVPVARLGGGFQTSGIEIAAGIKFGGGWIVGSNVFFQERFQVGGTQVGQQLRGYEEAPVTPTRSGPQEPGFFSALVGMIEQELEPEPPPPDPDDTPVRCWLKGKEHFSSRRDCLSRGGKAVELPE